MLLVTVLFGILYCWNQHEKVGGGSLECQIIQQDWDAMQGSAKFELLWTQVWTGPTLEFFNSMTL